MTREFKSANPFEIQDIVATYPFSRRITEVHLHHTWRPRQADYQGLATIESMWRYHTETNKWSDIGQHVTVAPNGAIWLCRNFNWAPASARGFNGNASAGPFMIEMIGDFDLDQESLSCEQLKATLAVIKSVQHRFQLDPHALRFHNEMSEKSCPGSSACKQDWIEKIHCFELESQRSRGSSMPFPSRATRAYELMRGMNPDAAQTDDMGDAEHDGNSTSEAQQSRGDDSAVRELTTDTLESLTAHAVNMERGQFSDSGRLETSRQDVDRLFEELLPQEIANARAERRRAQILLYAHGGLVSEKNALLSASKQLPFWRANGVYPIFFIWETGFAETVRQLVDEAFNRSQPPGETRGPLDWLTDNVTDTIIEDISRAGGGKLIWGGMKSSAELASEPDHAAAYVAAKAAELFASHPGDIDIHVAGHSAGSIFHAHFMPLLVEQAVKIKSVHYLAPAIRNDLFIEKVAPLLGQGIGPLSVFTMNKQREKSDSVTPLYNKSLLYLISRAFEDRRDTDILGLEESLRRDTATRTLFGLQGAQTALAEVIWSPTPDSQSGNGSTAVTHGGFDDDPHTMESVLRRMLDLRNGEPVEPFPAEHSRSVDSYWTSQFDWPENLEHLSRVSALSEELWQGRVQSSQTSDISQVQNDTPQQLHPSDASTDEVKPAMNGKGYKKQKKKHGKAGKKDKAAQQKNPGAHADLLDKSSQNGTATKGYSPLDSDKANGKIISQGRLMALCIGIDRYQRSPLAGCVADARLWKKTLSTLGYTVTLLKDEEATAHRIRESVADLVSSSRAGDRLVLQFAGHGTQFVDTDGDESGGDSPALDECLCAADCDFADDGLVIDDELRMIIETLPEGVSMTCFFDCCHSGSATRAALMMAGSGGGKDVRARFLSPSKHMEKVYRKRLRKIRKQASRAPARQRDVLFSACRSTELAYESDRQGDFTRLATQVLASGTENMSNTEFLECVLQAFGSTPRQHPEIHCDIEARQWDFLWQKTPEGTHPTVSGTSSKTAAPGPDRAKQLAKSALENVPDE